MIKHIKSLTIGLVNLNPYIWNIAWNLLNKFHFLLPHDDSYWALKHFIHSDADLFLDVGANTGISALSFRKISKIVPIISLEPNILHAQILSKLKIKVPYFSYLLVGAGDENKEMDFYTPVYKKIVLHTFTSICEKQIFNAIDESFGKKTSKLVRIEKTKAKIIKIDDLDIKPTIIKIDAEGYDYEVMIGAKQTIIKEKPFIMFEACWHQLGKIRPFIEDLGYQLYKYNFKNDYFELFIEEELAYKAVEKNIFAIHNEKKHFLPIKKA